MVYLLTQHNSDCFVEFKIIMLYFFYESYYEYISALDNDVFFFVNKLLYENSSN